MTYRVIHQTAYTYESEVSASYGEAHLLPRDMPGQVVLSSSLEVSPAPGQVTERTDYFGNRTHHFELHSAHTRLRVTADSLVQVSGRGLFGGEDGLDPAITQPWEAVRALLDAPGDAETLAAVEFTLPSPQVGDSAAAAAYAVPSFTPGRPVLAAVEHLSHRINRDFSFRPGATGVGTPVDQVLGRRAGVCQDFAHLTLACVRSMGLAARYVSGYLETDPPPGQPKLQGSDVSHAWASLYVPGYGWIDIDPTNDQFVGDRYITTGWGRDYGDVAPLNGVIFTDGETESLRVSVDVRRVPEPLQPEPQQPESLQPESLRPESLQPESLQPQATRAQLTQNERPQGPPIGQSQQQQQQARSMEDL